MSGKRTSFTLVAEEPLRLGLELGHIFEIWHPEDLEHGDSRPGTKPICRLLPGSYSLRSRPVPAIPPVVPVDTDDGETLPKRFMAYSQINPGCGAALAIIDPDSAPPRKIP